MWRRNPKYLPRKCTIIGIAGTAKNTGKTTTLNCLLQEASRRNYPVAVTSIGFDGEEIDNITSLPKPRITVYPNFVVTTSQKCLEHSTAKVEILQRTGFYTSLGEIVIVQVIQKGLVVIAGPNKTNELRVIVETMKSYPCDYLFVDGSLNRIVPMAAVDSIIFTTGGARSTDISELCNEMQTIESFFQFPIIAHDTIGAADTLNVSLLLEGNDIEELSLTHNKNKSVLYISTMISSAALERLTDYCVNGRLTIQTIIFPSPFPLLVQEKRSQIEKYLSDLRKLNMRISYLHTPQLSCITANPFFPEHIGSTYSERYLNNHQLMTQLQQTCRTPIFNTQETAPAVLFDACVK